MRARATDYTILAKSNSKNLSKRLVKFRVLDDCKKIENALDNVVDQQPRQISIQIYLLD
jgi:hypothetical protein